MSEIGSNGGTGWTPDQPMVSIKDVYKSFGELEVLKGVSMDIMKGECICIIGPSGSGKSTLIRCVNALNDIQKGSILVEGQEVNDPGLDKLELRKKVGMVFQQYNLFPHKTAIENIMMAPIHVLKQDEKEVEELARQLVKKVRLEGKENSYPGELSGGQQQRVAVARALVYEPKLVLMDEPLGALDKQLREQMQIELKHIHEHVGVTFVYVTHDQSEALTMSNRIVVFNDGEVQQIATPEELYEQPQNSFVAQFIGENNRLQGEITAMNGENCTVKIEGGGSVQALAVKVDGVGARTVLSIRPESVLFEPSADSVPNRFDCRVEGLIYLGDHTRVRVDVCGHDDFIIKVARSESAPRIEVGQTMPIGWKSHDCRALDPD